MVSGTQCTFNKYLLLIQIEEAYGGKWRGGGKVILVIHMLWAFSADSAVNYAVIIFVPPSLSLSFED